MLINIKCAYHIDKQRISDFNRLQVDIFERTYKIKAKRVFCGLFVENETEL